jgi:hypothetical protein
MMKKVVKEFIDSSLGKGYSTASIKKALAERKQADSDAEGYLANAGQKDARKKNDSITKAILVGIAALIIALVMFTSFIFLDSKNDSSNPIEAVDCNGFARDACYSSFAAYQQDAMYCDSVTEPGARSLCILNVALSKNDPLICSQLEKDEATICRTLFR